MTMATPAPDGSSVSTVIPEGSLVSNLTECLLEGSLPKDCLLQAPMEYNITREWFTSSVINCLRENNFTLDCFPKNHYQEFDFGNWLQYGMTLIRTVYLSNNSCSNSKSSSGRWAYFIYYYCNYCYHLELLY